MQLERWEEAVKDYEVLRRELPNDNEVAESLFHAQVVLKKSRGEEVYNSKFGGEVEEVSGLEQFRAAISLPGVCVVHFEVASNSQCKQISPFVDTLCGRYLSINFLRWTLKKVAAYPDLDAPNLHWEKMALCPVPHLDGAAIQIRDFLFFFACYDTIEAHDTVVLALALCWKKNAGGSTFIVEVHFFLRSPNSS